MELLGDARFPADWNHADGLELAANRKRRAASYSRVRSARRNSMVTARTASKAHCHARVKAK
jgi:hypothetical protein